MDGSTCCGPERAFNPGYPGENPPELQYKDGGKPLTPCCYPKVEKATSGPKEDLILIKGGSYTMGTNNTGWSNSNDGESPAREVIIKPFYISPTTITNKQFQEFINATGYRTEADRFGWSFVFHALLSEKQRRDKAVQPVPGLAWWYKVDEANWRRPEGRGTHIKKRMNHPVVHISWIDAYEFCKWKGWRMVREAEWEFAAKAGVNDEQWWWSDELEPDGKHAMNVWQGNFPHENSEEDGFLGTAPAKHYKPNKFGLYNVTGNVWEWTADWFSNVTAEQPAGSERLEGPNSGTAKVMKGGSFLCHESYCNRYRLPARTGNTPDSAASNIGFRVACDLTDEELATL